MVIFISAKGPSQWFKLAIHLHLDYAEAALNVHSYNFLDVATQTLCCGTPDNLARDESDVAGLC